MQIFIGGETGKGKVKPNPPGPSLPPIFNKKTPCLGQIGSEITGRFDFCHPYF